MKHCLSLLLLFPVVAVAQDCKLKNQKDVYTKEVKISTGFIPIGAAQVSIEATKSEIDFMFSLGSGRCFDDGSTAAVFFEGNLPCKIWEQKKLLLFALRITQRKNPALIFPLSSNKH